MVKGSIHCLILSATATVLSIAQAQPAPAARPDPLDSNASVPRIEHRSSLASYRRHSEETVRSWREANDAVNRIGGWRAYLREAREPESAASGAAKPSAAPPAGSTKTQ